MEAELCNSLKQAFLQAGIDDQLMRLLLEPNNRDILSELRLELLARRILARRIKQTELKEHPMEGIFSFDFENLGLLPSQWIKLFEARGQTGTPCIIPEQEADIFRSSDAFRETIQVPSPTMILVPMMIEENPNAIIQAITDTNHIAEKQARGCLKSTVPGLIFDTLLHLWGQLNDINAAFIVVPKIFKTDRRSMVPAILNNNTSTTLTVVHPSALQQGSYGYCAYCT